MRQLNQVEKRRYMAKLIATLLFAIAFFSIGSANAKSEFTCEKIKDKATRKSCIEDRVNNENEKAAAVEREKAVAAEREKAAAAEREKAAAAEREKAAAAEREMEASKRAEISSTCTLNGRSVVECTFKNTGNKKGSSCEKIALIPNKLTDSYVPQVFKLLGSQRVTSSLASQKQILRNYLAEKGRSNMSTNLDGEALVESASKILNSEKMVFSDNEICSGIVESGDIRQVNSTVAFYGKSVDEICGGFRGGWSAICSFTTLPTEKVINMINEELNK